MTAVHSRSDRAHDQRQPLLAGPHGCGPAGLLHRSSCSAAGAVAVIQPDQVERPERPGFIGLGQLHAGARRPATSWAPSATPPIWLLVAVTVPTVLGLLLAVLLDRPLRASRFYKSAFYMPITLSLVVVGQVWIWIYQPDWGLLNSVLDALGLERPHARLAGRPCHRAHRGHRGLVLAADRPILILYLAALTTVPGTCSRRPPSTAPPPGSSSAASSCPCFARPRWWSSRWPSSTRSRASTSSSS